MLSLILKDKFTITQVRSPTSKSFTREEEAIEFSLSGIKPSIILSVMQNVLNYRTNRYHSTIALRSLSTPSSSSSVTCLRGTGTTGAAADQALKRAL